MAKVNLNDKETERKENIQQTVSKTEQFFNNNKKLLWGILIAVVVIFVGALAYSKFVYQPSCEEAMQQAFPAENNFQNGEYKLALEGDGNVLGFADIIDTYGSKAGKAVYLYAGICELQLGAYEEALTYLNKYKGKEPVLAARALSCKGDAYVALENYDAALKCYQAAAASESMFSAAYLLKEGSVFEKLGDKAGALKCYETIKDMYPQSIEGYDIDKYISRVSE